MKKNLLDILACPIDKNYPLELIELDVKDEIYTVKNKLDKDEHNNEDDDNQFKDTEIGENQLHEEKVSVIIDGILYCDKCFRFYPIIDEIPIMLPDELREKEKDIRFLERWRKNIPEKILKFAKPWHL
ncbi:MAG: Trm112 family protein [Nitrososphaeraceae archaeon]